MVKRATYLRDWSLIESVSGVGGLKSGGRRRVEHNLTPTKMGRAWGVVLATLKEGEGALKVMR